MAVQRLLFDLDDFLKYELKPKKDTKLVKGFDKRIDKLWKEYYNYPEDNLDGKNRVLQQIELANNERKMFNGEDFEITIRYIGKTEKVWYSSLKIKGRNAGKEISRKALEYAKTWENRGNQAVRDGQKKIIKSLKRATESIESGFLGEKSNDEYEIIFSFIGTELNIETLK